MTVNTLEERKRYINEIKASFQNPGKSEHYRDITGTTPETPAAATSFFKWKALIAIVIFAAFVYCDMNQIKIYDYTTKEVYQQIEANISIEKIIQSMESMVQYSRKQ